MKFAVVDIETTGLFHQGHGITEIAVAHVDEDSIATAFHTMVRPERTIPLGITHLTGISEEMVSQAPAFSEILPGLLNAISGRILVAHNVSFDYQFLKANAEKHGHKITNKRLCTLKLARKVWPNEASYRLSALCAKGGITNKSPHRASGDAIAAAELLMKLIQDDNQGHLKLLLGSTTRDAVLPAHLSRADIEGLPDSPGVYYFYGSDQRPIYIGKAKNLQRRVLSHFTGAGSSRKKQLFQREIHTLTYTQTPTEYQAWLLEDLEIKKYWPRFNAAQKVQVRSYAVVVYKERSGLDRIGIVSSAQNAKALAWFTSPGSAREWLQRASLEYGWNPSRAGLFSGEMIANDTALERKNFQDFVESTREQVSTSFILYEGPVQGSYPFVLVEGGRYRGFGTSNDLRTFDPNDVRLAPESSVARSIVRKMLTDDNVFLHPI